MNMYILAIGILTQIFIGDSYTGPATPGGTGGPCPPPPPLERRAILKISSTVFRRAQRLSIVFRINPLRGSVFLC